ncbi:hypothetical protein A4G19_11450 [Pasteurellaceae bacterium Macca]|nr:hypothetical protein [Pasteurellaceae bacterium Macca]
MNYHQLSRCIKQPFFQRFILFIIILNAIVIGLQTDPWITSHFGKILENANHLFSIIFILEVILKLIVYRTKFFRRKWDLFDSFVILISLVPETSVISAFRFLRVFRILRMISIIPHMQFITQVLLRTLSSIFSVGTILMVVYYIYAVIVTNLYGKDFPQWFGDIGESYYTLFQIMTFESWSMGLVRPIMEIHPYSWIIFISFLILATYIVLNLVIGIIVDCINEIKVDPNQQACEESEKLAIQISQLENEIKALKALLIEKTKC